MESKKTNMKLKYTKKNLIKGGVVGNQPRTKRAKMQNQKTPVRQIRTAEQIMQLQLTPFIQEREGENMEKIKVNDDYYPDERDEFVPYTIVDKIIEDSTEQTLTITKEEEEARENARRQAEEMLTKTDIILLNDKTEDYTKALFLTYQEKYLNEKQTKLFNDGLLCYMHTIPFNNYIRREFITSDLNKYIVGEFTLPQDDQAIKDKRRSANTLGFAIISNTTQDGNKINTNTLENWIYYIVISFTNNKEEEIDYIVKIGGTAQGIESRMKDYCQGYNQASTNGKLYHYIRFYLDLGAKVKVHAKNVEDDPVRFIELFGTTYDVKTEIYKVYEGIIFRDLFLNYKIFPFLGKNASKYYKEFTELSTEKLINQAIEQGYLSPLKRESITINKEVIRTPVKAVMATSKYSLEELEKSKEILFEKFKVASDEN